MSGIGKIVKEIRHEQKVKLRELAELSQVHLNTIMRLESGGGVGLGTLEKILDALGYEIELVLKED